MKAAALFAVFLCFLMFAGTASARPETVEKDEMTEGVDVMVGAPEALVIPTWGFMIVALVIGVALGGVVARVRL
ncbi:hypothetical protein ES706_02365 [subsurface metagenome]